MEEEINNRQLLELCKLVNKQQKAVLTAAKTLKKQQESLAELTFKASANSSIQMMFFSILIRANPSLVKLFTKIIINTLDGLKQTDNHISNVYLIGQLNSILKNIQDPSSEYPYSKVVKN